MVSFVTFIILTRFIFESQATRLHIAKVKGRPSTGKLKGQILGATMSTINVIKGKTTFQTVRSLGSGISDRAFCLLVIFPFLPKNNTENSPRMITGTKSAQVKPT